MKEKMCLKTDDPRHPLIVGSENGLYTLIVSRNMENYEFHIGDFLSYCKAYQIECLLDVSSEDMKSYIRRYKGHWYNEVLRPQESCILIHSTDRKNWEQILKDAELKSWNILKGEGYIKDDKPFGQRLNDPESFRDFIMFSKGMNPEIVTASKQIGKIATEDTYYHYGCRLYFDAEKMADDGLLIRDGCHYKVFQRLPLKPYLLFAANRESLGLDRDVLKVRDFQRIADDYFQEQILSKISRKRKCYEL